MSHSRSLRELLDLVETLKGRGLALVSLEEKIDTGSAAGELIFHVFAAIAHFERRLGSLARGGGFITCFHVLGALAVKTRSLRLYSPVRRM